jgi:hypothetical protein
MRLEIPEYKFTIFQYRGYYYFEFNSESELIVDVDTMRDNGFTFRPTNVHGADCLLDRWSRRKSKNGTDGLHLAAKGLMECQDNKYYLREQGINKIEHYMEIIKKA